MALFVLLGVSEFGEAFVQCIRRKLKDFDGLALVTTGEFHRPEDMSFLHFSDDIFERSGHIFAVGR